MFGGGLGRTVRFARAKHAFIGKNNDELCFRKGDFVVITQTFDEAWWEGTLNGVTGWFPATFVEEVRPEQIPESVRQRAMSGNCPVDSQPMTPHRGAPGGTGSNTNSPAHQKNNFHSEVLSNAIDMESCFVKELETSWTNLLQPLSTSSILPRDEFAPIFHIYEDILALHTQVLAALKDCARQALNQRRVGRIFLEHSPAMRNVYERYAASHPRVIRLLHAQLRSRKSPMASPRHHHNDLIKFMNEHSSNESRSTVAPTIAPSAGDMQALFPLTRALALPLHHLEKIPDALRELERHLDDGHFDRGDTQRALTLAKQLITDCQDLRELRDFELDLASASIAKLPSHVTDQQGRLATGVVFLSPVKLVVDTDVVDRIFVLYPTCLLILSAETADLRQLRFEVELQLESIYVDQKMPVEELQGRFLHAFSLYCKQTDIASEGEETFMVVVLASATLRQRWINLLSANSSGGSAARKSIGSPAATRSEKFSEKVNGNNGHGHRHIERSPPPPPVPQPAVIRQPQEQIIEAASSSSLSLQSVNRLLSRFRPLCPAPITPSTLTSSASSPLSLASPYVGRKGGAQIAASAGSSTASTPTVRKRLGMAIVSSSTIPAALLGVAVSPTAGDGQPDHQLSTMLADQALMSTIEGFIGASQAVDAAADEHTPMLNRRSNFSFDSLTAAGPGTAAPLATIENGFVVEPFTPSNGNQPSMGQFSAASLHQSSLLIPEDEKLLLDNLDTKRNQQGGDMGRLEERTLVDAVYALWDYVGELRREVADLKAALNGAST